MILLKLKFLILRIKELQILKEIEKMDSLDVNLLKKLMSVQKRRNLICQLLPDSFCLITLKYYRHEKR